MIPRAWGTQSQQLRSAAGAPAHRAHTEKTRVSAQQTLRHQSVLRTASICCRPRRLRKPTRALVRLMLRQAVTSADTWPEKAKCAPWKLAGRLPARRFPSRRTSLMMKRYVGDCHLHAVCYSFSSSSSLSLPYFMAGNALQPLAIAQNRHMLHPHIQPLDASPMAVFPMSRAVSMSRAVPTSRKRRRHPLNRLPPQRCPWWRPHR